MACESNWLLVDGIPSIAGALKSTETLSSIYEDWRWYYWWQWYLRHCPRLRDMGDELQGSCGRCKDSDRLRYVSVIRLVLQLLPIRITNQNLYCISKSTLKHQPTKDWKSDHPIVFTTECRVVFSIQRRSPIYLKQVSLWCLLFDPHRTTC